MKIRDKKNFTKKLHGGAFFCGTIFPGSNFPGGVFSGFQTVVS